jgi:heptosyltransferase-2
MLNLTICTSIHKILIRAVNWVGDAVMTTPALGTIRSHFPQAEIVVLANPLVSQIFLRHEWVDRVITFDRQREHRGIVGRLRLAMQLRKESFDAAIIFPNSFDSALVPWLAGIPVRLGKASDGRSFMLTERYLPDAGKMLEHEVEYYLGLLQHFGLETIERIPHLLITEEEASHASSILAQHGIRANDFLLGINPGAAFGSAKRWYPDRFAEVAKTLAVEWGAKVVVFGGSSETDIAGLIEQQLDGNCLNLAAKTTVRELMALIQRCNFFVTNDSGPMHVAAALQVPLVAVFGSTDHTTTSPYTRKAAIVRKDVSCAPCKLRECPTDHRCMSEVTAGDVVRESIRLMASLSGSRQ